MNTALQLFEAGEPGAAVELVVSELDRVRRSMSKDVWREVARWAAAHPIARYLHSDPFTHRAFTKPRGYAEDAVMMDLIYGIEPCVAPPDVAPISEYTTGRGCSPQAVRYRRVVLASTIDDVARERGRVIHVTAIAAGHLREAAISAAVQQGIAAVTAVDQDVESLAVITRDYEHLDVQVTQGSVRGILSKKTPLPEADLVYSAGLYDYLAEPVARRLTEVLFASLAPGGRLLLANFTPTIPDIGYMESFMDWHLIYRTDEQMRELITGLPKAELGGIRQFQDPMQAITFLQVSRRA